MYFRCALKGVCSSRSQLKVNFIIWSPTKINKDERPHITVGVGVHMSIHLHAYAHSSYICIQLLQSWWPRHMTICGVKLLGYSLVVLACVSWCFHKQIPGRFRVSTGQGSLPGCRYFGCGGAWVGGTILRTVVSSPVVPCCLASGPEDSVWPALFTGTDRAKFSLSFQSKDKKRIKILSWEN